MSTMQTFRPPAYPEPVHPTTQPNAQATGSPNVQPNVQPRNSPNTWLSAQQATPQGSPPYVANGLWTSTGPDSPMPSVEPDISMTTIQSPEISKVICAALRKTPLARVAVARHAPCHPSRARPQAEAVAMFDGACDPPSTTHHIIDEDSGTDDVDVERAVRFNIERALNCLDTDKWLNDDVINTVGQVFETQDTVWVSSFLTGTNKTRLSQHNIKRRKMEIARSFLLPLHHKRAQHWTLAHVKVEIKTIELYDSFPSSRPSLCDKEAREWSLAFTSEYLAANDARLGEGSWTVRQAVRTHST